MEEGHRGPRAGSLALASATAAWVLALLAAGLGALTGTSSGPPPSRTVPLWILGLGLLGLEALLVGLALALGIRARRAALAEEQDAADLANARSAIRMSIGAGVLALVLAVFAGPQTIAEARWDPARLPKPQLLALASDPDPA
ncbi:MAG: hypothetical protein L0216_15620 [Planctomycetales bacterium]|nr:hypothetical protein [Planctomycetales bacterium]